MRMWVCVTCSVYELHTGRECEFEHVSLCVWFFFFPVCTWLSWLPDKAYWSRFGIVASVVSCVSVSSRRFDWPSVALCRATSPLFLWEWRAYTESCPGVTASSQQHNWLTLLNCCAAFPIHELSFRFTERTGSTKQSHPFSSFFFLSFECYFLYCKLLLRADMAV